MSNWIMLYSINYGTIISSLIKHAFACNIPASTQNTDSESTCPQLEVLRGRDGRDGRDGMPGAAGPQGDKGERGDPGGPQGPRGLTGATGAQKTHRTSWTTRTQEWGSDLRQVGEELLP